MNGIEDPTNGALTATSGPQLGNGGLSRTVAAWERFAAGADTVQGVRPEILMSWYRCREEYGVSPGLDRAPEAAEASPHSIERDMVLAELGGVAAFAGENIGGDALATVTDPEGRVLVSYGSRRVLRLAADSNLAPWYAWSEWASGTNGMGTALQSHGPVIVAGPEHWCRAFHAWSCAGIAVRDAVTDEPLAALGLSWWKTPLPGNAVSWLRDAVAATEASLRQRAYHVGTVLAAAFADSRPSPSTPLAAVDVAGKVVLASADAADLLGTPADTAAYAAADRWAPRLPALSQLVRLAMACARHDPGWCGATQVFVPLAGAPVPVAVHPVRIGDEIAGALLAFGSRDFGDGDLPDGDLPAGELPAALPAAAVGLAAAAIPAFGASSAFGVVSAAGVVSASGPTPGSAHRALAAHRVVALRQDRWVLLDPSEIRFAEVDRNDVWLMSDLGRLLAATRGLDHLQEQLQDKRFLRVHRRFLVNLDRIREIEQGFKGSLFLHTDTRTHESIPVARRHMAEVRRALGL